MQTVAVVGGSNGGYAAAADFADQGFDVQWYVRSPDNHRRVLERETITLAVSENYIGRRTPGERREVTPHLVTTDLGEAVSGADLVLVPLPTTTQEAVAETLVPHLEDGQVVVTCPGNCGSVLFRRALDDLDGSAANVVFAETPTLPYVTRKSGPAEVTINLDAVRLPVGAFPGRDTDRAYEATTRLYDAALPAENALDAALNNSNACVNATPTLLNAGAIECDEFAFNIHRHGVTESVYEVILAVDDERVRIREALGYGDPHFTQDEYYEPGPETGEHFYGARSREALVAADTFSEDPPSLDDRYVHEDVSIATVLLASLGDALDLQTPTIDSLVHIAETMMDEPYAETGRTLELLGLDTGSQSQLEAVLERGFDAR
ncbi:NAD/NADP octopine/nopaline dehydrogenase family protein [Haloarchaeobius sp. HRN-SO-5]|uniref:NAD/NADP octopine/nopaline dehydrogenase family protein n=1 Tax=Haloarchaeobius sp. HRN-SO-5 TaxID=3446118 RepID=UPI003EBD29AA